MPTLLLPGVIENAQQTGEKDAEAGIPAVGQQEIPSYITGMRDAAQGIISKLEEGFEDRDAGLHRQYCEATIQKRHTGQRHAEAEHDLEIEKTRYRDENKSEPRVTLPVASNAHWATMALLFLFEVPINTIIFQQFGDNMVGVLLLSLGMAAALALCAEQTGAHLRQPKPWSAGFWVVLGLLQLLPVVVFAWAAVLRQSAVVELQQRLAEDAGGAAQTNPVAVFWIFLALGAICYLVGCYLSWLYHDPVRLAYGVERRWFNAAQDAATREETLRADRAGEARSVGKEMEQVNQEFQRICSAYSEHNIREQMRSGKIKQPSDLPVLCQYPVITIAPQFADPEKLDWTCR